MTPIPISHSSVAATELFRKNGDVTRGKLSLQHVPTTCPPQHVTYKQLQKPCKIPSIFARVSPTQMEYLCTPPSPLINVVQNFDMSIKVTRNNIERGRGVGRANKALIPFQQAALTRKSDFPRGSFSTVLQMLVVCAGL